MLSDWCPLKPDPQTMWYYVEDGQQRGPVIDADFEALRREGKITADTLIWREGMGNWLPLAQVAEAPGGPALRMAGMPVEAGAVPVGVGAGGGSTVGGASSTVTCSECGGIFPASEVIRYGNASVCAACKPVFMQKLREGAKVSGGPMELASFWTRFGAYFVDGIITGVIGAIGAAAAGAAMGAAGAASSATGLIVIQFVGMGISMAVRAAYFIYFIGKDGQTPGKKLCKIKVVNADGTQVTYGKATGRFFGYLLSSLICGIGFLMAGWDDEKRALHDRLCDTRVIKL
jgi:uncharacterized RDD family membrane protein YckC